MSRCKQPLRLRLRNKILRSANAKYHYSYLFFYKINKGDLPLMYSFVVWCEFIDLVGFFGCYCLTSAWAPDLCHSLHNTKLFIL